MSSPVDRLNAALAGRYSIERQLGEGGMATVYLATDVRHARRVALKVLKPELAAVVGAERFLTEIRTTANLQHPHILPLFDSGEADGMLFYVMPYVEGESLRDRLDREGQLPVDEAIRIATNVAEALDYAHSRGVVHRDIKPANILLQAGKPVVADFGIALAVSLGGGGRLTETGLSLGTPHYMSPEQATGDMRVGAPTDIYALGCVLYEMLVGEPPYTGSTPQAILGKIIVGEGVSATKLRPSVPAHVDAAVRKALERVPADRFASASEMAKALGDAGFGHEVRYAMSPLKPRQWRVAGIAAGSLLAGAIAAVVATSGRSGSELLPVMRFLLATEGREELFVSTYGQDVAVSPDGGLIVHVGSTTEGTRPQLFVRPIDQEEPIPIAGAEGGVMPFFSPDGSWIGFVDSQDRTVVKRIRPSGGASEVVGRIPAPVQYLAGAIWTDDGRIVAGTGGQFGLYEMPSDGGTARQLTRGPHHWPSAVGDHAILFMNHAPGFDLAVLDLRTGEIRSIGIQGTSPQYVRSGHLLFVGGDGSLQAAPFDPETLVVEGDPVRLWDGLDVKRLEGGASIAISTSGHLVFTTGYAGLQGLELVRVSRAGSRTSLMTTRGVPWYPRFSPDGEQLAFGLAPELGAAGDSDLWVYDLSRSAPTRITFNGDNRYVPTWSRDGLSLTHSDGTGAQNQVVSTAADGTGIADTLLGMDGRRFPTSWGPDGILAIYVGPQGTPTNTRDLGIMRRDAGGFVEETVVATPFAERAGAFSPDGRWLAYVSDRSGQDEVYVRPFPGPGPEITISIGGGDEPVWAPSGAELFYRTPTTLEAVSVENLGSALRVGRPTTLFPDPYVRDMGGGAAVPNYDVSQSGDWFVMVGEQSLDESSIPQRSGLHLVLNFFEELRARVPN